MTNEERYPLDAEAAERAATPFEVQRGLRLDPALAAALVAAQRAAQAVEKGATNTFHRYKYASAESIIAEARVALSGAGLALVRVERGAGAVAQWAADGDRKFSDLRTEYVLVHESGAALRIEDSTPAIAERGRPEDKAVATAETYSLGYTLRSLLLLPRVEEGTDVDQRDDRAHVPGPQAAAQRTSPPPRRGRPAPPKPAPAWTKPMITAVADALARNKVDNNEFITWIHAELGVSKLIESDPTTGFDRAMTWIGEQGMRDDIATEKRDDVDQAA